MAPLAYRFTNYVEDYKEYIQNKLRVVLTSVIYAAFEFIGIVKITTSH